ncbi:MAG: glycosyltransferase family 2 protein [Bryobacteraceae bacterium]
MLSLIIPLYKSEEGLTRLLAELHKLQEQLQGEPLEVVFVVDGSPDRCYEILAGQLPAVPLRTKLITLSRNFGSFAAISAGLRNAGGDIFAVLAADLQEPPALILEFVRILRADEADVCFGVRAGRSDPWITELMSTAFWSLYRRFVLKDMPSGGVDIFGCNRIVRDELLSLPEVNTNLIALLFWVGFRRRFVSYQRMPRLEGKSAWTFTKKLKYSFDSIFNFTDLPIQWLLAVGFGTSALSVILGSIVLWGRLRGSIQTAGYTPIILMIMFFGGLTALGLGIVGQYLWLSLQNSRRRPNFIVNTVQSYPEKSFPADGTGE